MIRLHRAQVNTDQGVIADMTAKKHMGIGDVTLNILHHSGLNVLAADAGSLRDRWDGLAIAGNKLFLDNKIPLSKYFRTWLDDKAISAMAVGLKEAASDWPPYSRPHGLIVDVATEIQGNRIIIDKRGRDRVVIEVNGTIDGINHRVMKGPYFVCVSITDTPDHRHYLGAAKAFVVPMSSGSGIPCFSDDERDVIKRIAGSLKWFQEKGVRLYLQKPLFDIKVDGHSCRPSLIARTDNKIICLAMNDMSSTDRKAMESVGDVVEIDLHRTGSERDEDLAKIVKMLGRSVFAGSMRNANELRNSNDS